MAKIVNFYPVGIQTFSNIREGNSYQDAAEVSRQCDGY